MIRPSNNGADLRSTSLTENRDFEEPALTRNQARSGKCYITIQLTLLPYLSLSRHGLATSERPFRGHLGRKMPRSSTPGFGRRVAPNRRNERSQSGTRTAQVRTPSDRRPQEDACPETPRYRTRTAERRSGEEVTDKRCPGRNQRRVRRRTIKFSRFVGDPGGVAGISVAR